MTLNMADYTQWGPNGVRVRDSTELTALQSLCVSEVNEHVTTRVDTEGSEIVNRNMRFKLHDKVSALNTLARHLGMFPTNGDKNQSEQTYVQFNFYIDGENPPDGDHRLR
jgi:hypothetical protein